MHLSLIVVAAAAATHAQCHKGTLKFGHYTSAAAAVAKEVFRVCKQED